MYVPITCVPQVVQKLTLGLGISAQSNRFALFEWNGEKFKVIDERALIADILAKFEKYVVIAFA